MTRSRMLFCRTCEIAFAGWRSFPLVLAGLSFALLGSTAAANAQPARVDSSKPIASLIDRQTFAVVHARLDRVDVGRLMALAGKFAELTPAEAATAELVGKLAVSSLVNAGATDVYVIASLDGFPYDMFCVALPVSGEESGGKIVAALKLALQLRDSGELMAKRTKDFVLVASRNTLKRLETMQPAVSPRLEKALASYPAADARLALVLPDTLRRSLAELMPELPRELGGGKTAPLLDGLHYLSAGITMAPKFSTEVTLRTDDAKTATALRRLLVDGMSLAAKEIPQDDPKMAKHLAWMKDLLTPKADRDALTWKLTEEEWIQTIGPLAAQMNGKRSNIASTNRLKQIALGMHAYLDVHKQFPTGIRDKNGKLLLSWRVQILPFIEAQHLYQQFKLDEPWDSEHNLKLASQMPAVFRSPNSRAAADRTTYLVPTGKGLFFDHAVRERKIQDIVDGTSNTIMILEADDDHAVIWTKPDDLNVDAKQPLKGLGGPPVGMIRAAFADGSVRIMNRKIAPAEFYKMLTIAGGEVIQE